MSSFHTPDVLVFGEIKNFVKLRNVGGEDGIHKVLLTFVSWIVPRVITSCLRLQIFQRFFGVINFQVLSFYSTYLADRR